MLKERHLKMEDTQHILISDFENTVLPLLKNVYYKSIAEESVQRLKRSTPPIRGYYLREIADTFLGKLVWQNNRKLRLLSLFIELEVYFHYALNKAFDRKNGIKSHFQVIETILNGLKEKYIVDQVFCSIFTDSLVLEMFKLSTFRFIVGEHIDLFRLSYDYRSMDEICKILLNSIEYEVIIELEDLFTSELQRIFEKRIDLKSYLVRCFLINASLFVLFVRMLFRLTFSSRNLCEKLTRYTAVFGILTQVMNDIIDYLPPSLQFVTKDKSLEDALSDFRNGILTLPLLIFLSIDEHESTMTRKLFYNRKVSSTLQCEVKQEIFYEMETKYGILSKSIDILRHIAHVYMNRIRKDFENCELDLYLDIWNVLIDNKYFKRLESVKEL